MAEKNSETTFYSRNFSNKNIGELSLSKLIGKLTQKRNIYVISCYYSEKSLNTFFEEIYKKGVHYRSTTVIVSAPYNSPEKLVSIIDDLMCVHLEKTQKLYVYKKFSLLHTKLYFSMNERQVESDICFIGSANLSNNAFYNNQEEILVKINNKDEIKAASNYIDCILDDEDNLIDIKEIKKEYEKSGTSDRKKFLIKKFGSEISLSNSVAGFLSSGYILFRANRTFSLTFTKKGSLWEEHLDKIGSIVPNIVMNQKNLDTYKILNIKAEKDDSVKIRFNSLETSYGYWVPPGTCYQRIFNLIENKKNVRRAKYGNILKSLKENSENLSSFSNIKLRETFDKIKEFDKNLDDSLYTDLKNEFIRFVKGRYEFFQKNKDAYIDGGYYLSPLPDFWDDSAATKKFTRSIIDDLTFRHTENGKSAVDAVYTYLNPGRKKDLDLFKTIIEPWVIFEKNFWGLDEIDSDTDDELEDNADDV